MDVLTDGQDVVSHHQPLAPSTAGTELYRELKKLGRSTGGGEVAILRDRGSNGAPSPAFWEPRGVPNSSCPSSAAFGNPWLAPVLDQRTFAALFLQILQGQTAFGGSASVLTEGFCRRLNTDPVEFAEPLNCKKKGARTACHPSGHSRTVSDINPPASPCEAVEWLLNLHC